MTSSLSDSQIACGMSTVHTVARTLKYNQGITLEGRATDPPSLPGNETSCFDCQRRISRDTTQTMAFLVQNCDLPKAAQDPDAKPPYCWSPILEIARRSRHNDDS